MWNGTLSGISVTLSTDSPRGDAGVKCWQQWLNRAGYTDKDGRYLLEDGDFGPCTEQATQKFQIDESIIASGQLDATTLSVASAIELPSLPSVNTFAAPARIIRIGKKFTAANRQIEDLTWVCIHTAECQDTPKSDEGIVNYLETSKVVASCTYAVDQDSYTQEIDEKNIAWHAAGINDESIGIELAGFAKLTRDEWLSMPHIRTLRNAAWLTADIVKRSGIPVVLADAAAIRAKTRGITTHAIVNEVFKGDHWDPGSGFPMDVFLQFVAELAS